MRPKLNLTPEERKQRRAAQAKIWRSTHVEHCRQREQSPERKAYKRAYQKYWRETHPTYDREYCQKRYAHYGDRYRAYARQGALKVKFGLRLETYDQLLQAQGGVCKICRKPPTRYRLAVDHDHHTQVIRGLLCGTCNTRLFVLEKWPFRAKAEEYLQLAQKT